MHSMDYLMHRNFMYCRLHRKKDEGLSTEICKLHKAFFGLFAPGAVRLNKVISAAGKAGPANPPLSPQNQKRGFCLQLNLYLAMPCGGKLTSTVLEVASAVVVCELFHV